MAYAPTHDIPAGGLPAWTQPDGSQPPVTSLAAGLDVQLLEMRGQWGHVACSNGWEGWIDATRLVARAVVTPEPEPVVTPEPEPAPAAAPGPEPVTVSSETGFNPTHTVPAEGAPMWADPDPSQAALATLAPGTEVRVVDQRGQWADITLANGWEGWVDATRLVVIAAPEPVAAPAPVTAAAPVSTPTPTSVAAFAPTHVAPTEGLQAWAAPDPSQPVATTLAAGTELRIAEQRGQWARVEASNGWWGWVDATRLAPR